LYTQRMKHVPARFCDFPSAAILTLVLLTASQRLFATSWAPGLEIALFLSFLGVIMGLALGASHFKPMGVFWIAFGYTITIIPLLAAGVFYQKFSWLERLYSLSERFENGLSLFAAKQPVPDTILFVIFAGLGFWVVSVLAGYTLTNQGDFMAAVVPSGIILFIIQLYDSGVGDSVIILAIYAFLCLLLLGRLTYVQKRLLWKAQHVSFSAESWTDINLAIPVAALVLVLAAWLTPATERPVLAARMAWENITRPFDNLRHDLGNAVSGLKGGVQGTIVDFYGDTLSLGLNASTGDNVYLRISVPLTGGADRYYWRVRTYDRYVDNQWQSANAYTEPFIPNQTAIQFLDTHGLASEFVFSSPQVNLSLLVTPANPVWISRPSVMSFSPSTGGITEPLMFRAEPPILIGEQYIVHAIITNPTILQLQKAGSSYPAWVHDQYLLLPKDLSPRITDLARSITAQAATPYDKAIAITNYLRSTITYSTTVDAPPSGTDPLVWFLFDTRKGFCNYYATAEVILLRIVGVPTRMVVGFAQGEYQPPDKYTVLEKDAHAWPEVYFPGIGWVEFEPTSGQPALARLPGNPTPTPGPSNATQNAGQNNPEGTPTPNQEPGGGVQGGTPPNSLLRVILFFGLIVIVIFGGLAAYTTGFLDKTLRRVRPYIRKPFPMLLLDLYASFAITPPGWLTHWAYVASLTPIERSFVVVFQSLHWLGARTSPAQTPAEATAVLIGYLPEVASEIRLLLKAYEHALFSQKHIDLFAARRAGMLIRRQALVTVIRQRILVFLEGFRGRASQKPN
jgi:transglutaminase-like putative cysteine protease